MMLHELVNELERRDIRVYVHDGHLRCKAPVDGLTPQLRSALQARKAEIITHLARTQHHEAAPIEPVARNGPPPLSFAQQRIWFLNQLEPNNPFYNEPFALRVEGSLDLSTLERVINEIVRRHEVLRTTVGTVEGRPIQVIAPALVLSVPVTDLSNMAADRREGEVRRLTTDEAQRPFDLSGGPLVRVSVLHLGQHTETRKPEHVVLFTLHHIVSDGWSLTILIREFMALYEAFYAGQPLPLPEVPIQYADFAVWQREWLQGDVLKQQIAFWKGQLAGAPPVLDLPTDHPRPAVQSNRGARYNFAVSKAVTEKLRALSRREDATLFMTLLTAFKVLLSRYSGQRDICVGSPIASRNRVEIEGLIGFFVNTLVLRTDLSGDPRFSELLTRVREVCLGAQSHQDLPFERLVEELQPVRDMSHSALFQVWFVLQSMSPRELELPGLNVSEVAVDTGTAKFDLTLDIAEGTEGLSAVFEYSTDLFDAGTIERMVGHFQTLLEGIAVSPDARLSELPLLREVEQRRLLIECNATATDYPRDKCIQGLFEAQVERSPETVAVVFEDQQLTYAELNAKANQLAHHLRSLGVAPEVRVGICVERSLEMIIGILGILKAGGAYVPIDPAYPKERVAFMLEDARPQVVLTQRHLQSSLPKHRTVFCLDSDWNSVACKSHENLANRSSPQNLAYIIYTSGTTGRPKGVAIEHRGVANLASWQAEKFQITDHSRISQFASYSFDASVGETFMALLNGATLVMLPRSSEPRQLIEAIDRYRITLAVLVPSLVRHLNFDQLTKPEHLTLVLVGETCSVDLALMVARKCTFMNAYGPTEYTVYSHVWKGTAQNISTLRSVPIGFPIHNTKSFILDASLNPVPAGVPGEIYISGLGIARGYLNRPDVTASRFLPCGLVDGFFGSKRAVDGSLAPRYEYSRMYRTGDLGRYRPDGSIEFFGRIDNQVKVRGYRIEPGEIEVRLIAHPDVKEAVVVAREDSPGDKRLVAYVVGREAVPTVERLRVHLKAVLPEYMVPSAFVFLDALPLTPNGKADRRALPVPDVGGQCEHQYVAPRTVTEEILANIWAEVVGVERVGVHDNFFEVGGHSILAVELLFKMQEIWKVELSLQTLFERPTVAAQAETLEQIVNSTVPLRGTEISLETEATLDSTITPVAIRQECNIDPRAIFLTGATGFLGAFLLHELLERTQAKVYCLVRASTISEATSRLRQNLVRYELWDPDQNPRILPVCGDLSLPRLGVSKVKFKELSVQIDVIYHSGAGVDFTQSYMSLKPANVGGTEEVLRLACIERTKPVHYVSTVSVFGDEADPGPTGIAEDDVPDPDSGLRGGYAQSKWVAERIVRVANARGLPVTIYRSTAITGDSYTGIWNTNDFLCRMIKACIELGKAPDSDDVLDMVPVDYASKAIVSLSTQDRFWGRTFHLNSPSPLPFKELIKWANTWGYCVEPIPFAQWLNAVRDVAKPFPDHILFPLLPLFDDEIPDSESRAEASRQRYDCRKTLKALSATGVTFPDTGADLLQTYFSYFVRSGFIPAPQLVAHLSPY